MIGCRSLGFISLIGLLIGLLTKLYTFVLFGDSRLTKSLKVLLLRISFRLTSATYLNIFAIL
jgi:hypothetical protein